jgi:hypothetical protein
MNGWASKLRVGPWTSCTPSKMDARQHCSAAPAPAQPLAPGSGGPATGCAAGRLAPAQAPPHRPRAPRSSAPRYNRGRTRARVPCKRAPCDVRRRRAPLAHPVAPQANKHRCEGTSCLAPLPGQGQRKGGWPGAGAYRQHGALAAT